MQLKLLLRVLKWPNCVATILAFLLVSGAHSEAGAKRVSVRRGRVLGGGGLRRAPQDKTLGHFTFRPGFRPPHSYNTSMIAVELRSGFAK